MGLTLFPINQVSAPESNLGLNIARNTMSNNADLRSLFGSPILEVHAEYGVFRDEFTVGEVGTPIKYWNNLALGNTRMEQLTTSRRPTLIEDADGYRGIKFESANSAFMSIQDELATSIRGPEYANPFFVVMVVTLDQQPSESQYFWAYDATGFAHRGLSMTSGDGGGFGAIFEQYNDDANNASAGTQILTTKSSFVMPIGKKCILLYAFNGQTSTIYHHDGENSFVTPIITQPASFGGNFTPHAFCIAGKFLGQVLTNPSSFADITVNYCAVVPGQLWNVEGLIRWLAPNHGIDAPGLQATTSLAEGLVWDFPMSENLTDRRDIVGGKAMTQFYNEGAPADNTQRIGRTSGVITQSAVFPTKNTSTRFELRRSCSGVFNLKNLADWTIEFWVYPTQSNFGANVFPVMLQWASDAAALADSFFRVIQGDTTPTALARFNDSSGNFPGSFTSMGTMNLNAWNQIVLWRTGNVIRGSLNNAAAVTFTYVDTALRDISAQVFGFGKRTTNTANDLWQGRVACFRGWHRALSDSERTALFNDNRARSLPFDASERGQPENPGLIVTPPPPTAGTTIYLGTKTAQSTPNNPQLRGPNRWFSYRFKARRNGTVKTVGFYHRPANDYNPTTRTWPLRSGTDSAGNPLPTDGTQGGTNGYTSGTGGTMRVQLCADSAGQPGTVLAQKDFDPRVLTDDLYDTGSFSPADQYKEQPFPDATLVADSYYHLRFQNVGTTPTSNFFSLNVGSNLAGNGNAFNIPPNADYSIVTNSSFWAGENWSSARHSPIFYVGYDSDGDGVRDVFEGSFFIWTGNPSGYVYNTTSGRLRESQSPTSSEALFRNPVTNDQSYLALGTMLNKHYAWRVIFLNNPGFDYDNVEIDAISAMFARTSVGAGDVTVTLKRDPLGTPVTLDTATLPNASFGNTVVSAGRGWGGTWVTANFADGTQQIEADNVYSLEFSVPSGTLMLFRTPTANWDYYKVPKFPTLFDFADNAITQYQVGGVWYDVPVSKGQMPYYLTCTQR